MDADSAAGSIHPAGHGTAQPAGVAENGGRVHPVPGKAVGEVGADRQEVVVLLGLKTGKNP